MNLRSTTRVQVFPNPGFGPLHPTQCLFETGPCVCPALALAVEPFEEDPRREMDIHVALLQVIRNGVVVEMSFHTSLGSAQHLSLPENVPRSTCPVRKAVQTLLHFLATCTALHLEVSLLGFPAVVRES